MPDHSTAAIASYPWLGVTNNVVKVERKWGISPNLFNVKDCTFQFLEDVLTEVISLFPSKYIHIGGDEAYTLDGSDPLSSSSLYTKPLKVGKGTIIKAGLFKDSQLLGKITQITL